MEYIDIIGIGVKTFNSDDVYRENYATVLGCDIFVNIENINNNKLRIIFL